MLSINLILFYCSMKILDCKTSVCRFILLFHYNNLTFEENYNISNIRT